MNRDACICHVTLRDGSWRERLWIEVFGKPELPVRSPFALDGFYTMDTTWVSLEQRMALAKGVATQFPGVSVEAVLSGMDKGEAPVLASPGMMVTGCRRHGMGAIL